MGKQSQKKDLAERVLDSWIGKAISFLLYHIFIHLFAAKVK